MRHLHKIVPVLWMIAIVWLAIIFPRLPELVGTHFSFSGHADEMGSKSQLWIVPIVFLILWVVITLLATFAPKLEKNLNQARTEGTEARIRGTLTLFTVVQIGIWILYSAHLYLLSHNQDRIPGWLMLALFIIIVIAFIYKVRQSLRYR
ncbi:DUF1648 domain-containing protein [Staphylococcus canis]|uniref:DUF1648 domain-containing protein n=1 Tax=Staphylococcus canis TaxID=2724942 RepID=A0ABS0T6Z5_9STAP|nr:DUF1648 domain-containing protein [Staphylococcus canis]MBI5974457.1 DUF1648 domain-containing protein [Staphylococcus canis]